MANEDNDQRLAGGRWGVCQDCGALGEVRDVSLGRSPLFKCVGGCKSMSSGLGGNESDGCTETG